MSSVVEAEAVHQMVALGSVGPWVRGSVGPWVRGSASPLYLKDGQETRVAENLTSSMTSVPRPD